MPTLGDIVLEGEGTRKPGTGLKLSCVELDCGVDLRDAAKAECEATDIDAVGEYLHQFFVRRDVVPRQALVTVQVKLL